MNTTNRLSNPLLHYGLLTLMYGVAVLTLLSHIVLHSGHTHADVSIDSAPAVAIVDCIGTPVQTHKLTVTDKAIVPNNVTAQRCDQLEIINQTTDPFIAALGPHEHHTKYPGFHETVLQHGQTYSFRLSEAGTFPLHDHDNDSLRATLVVRD